MPAVSLCCRICATEHPLEATGTCSRCFGPLDPDLRLGRAARPRQSRVDRGRAAVDLALRRPAPGRRRPTEARLAPGMTPLVPAPRLAEELGIGELWLKLDTANPTHSFKDRVVAVAARKAQELGLDTLSCSSTGNLAGAVAARAAAEGLEAAVFVPSDLEPEKLAAAAVYGPRIYAVDGTYDHCSRLSVELSFELPWGFVNVNLRSYYAEGSKTLAYEIAEQLGWETPGRGRDPDRLGCALPQGRPGLRRARRARPRRRRRRRRSSAARRPAASPSRPPSARAPAWCRCGPRASPARSRSATLPTATSPSRRRGRRAARSTRSPRTRSAPTWPHLAATTGVFGETATGVTLGALKAAVAAGQIGPQARVVLLVTGDGLKTPGPGLATPTIPS